MDTTIFVKINDLQSKVRKSYGDPTESVIEVTTDQAREIAIQALICCMVHNPSDSRIYRSLLALGHYEG